MLHQRAMGFSRRLIREISLCAVMGASAGCSDAPGATNAETGLSPLPPRRPEPGDGDTGSTATPSPQPAPDSNAGAIVVDLGIVTAGQAVSLDLPVNALGFNVTVSSEGAGTMGIEKIVSPTGTIVHDRFMPTNGVDANAVGIAGMGSASVPQNDLPEALRPQAGKWKITFGGAGPNAHARARVQTAINAQFRGGVLDLHVHLPLGLKVPGPSATKVVNAQGAASDPDIAGRVDSFFFALESSIGIDRGKVTFHDAPADFVAVNDDPTFYRATAISKGFPEEHALHVLLTNDLYNGEYSGYSPGVPGAASITGSTMSGLVLALADESNAIEDGYTWLHEMAHFVGLQHTSESDGLTFDPLSDTAKCPGTRTPACGDASNLMIPGWWPNNALPKVSKTQQAIFRASPIYRATATTTSLAQTAWRPSLTAFSVTRSGRPLSPTEQFLSGTFCRASRQTPAALVASQGRAETIAALQAIARDADLPSRYRRKALRMLDRVE